mgnify:CR=1 FL=1
MKIEIPEQIQVRLSGTISRGVKAVEVDEAGHLIFTLTDGSTQDLGSVIGPKGDKGDTGDKGEKGAAGPQGPKGDTGATGAQGEPGKGFSILGYFATATALNAAKQATAQPGDAYGVGTEAPYDVYIFDGQTDTFVNNGKLQGAKGDKGDTGAQGEKGETGAQGPKGDTGATGPQGPKGETGPQGPKGDTGATGPQGPAGTVDDTGLMQETEYDPTGKVKAAGGIPGYVTAAYAEVTLTSSGWSGKTYSLESEYASFNYDITVGVAPGATVAQYDAFSKAKICGNAVRNALTALGTVPTVDIPVIVKAVRK